MKIVVVGASGYMGKMLKSALENTPDIFLVGEVHRSTQNPEQLFKKATVVIDFSHPSALDLVLSANRPLVIGTTGYREDQMEKIKDYSKTYPVLYSSNFSLGIASCKSILAALVNHFNPSSIDILDIHQEKKKDAPSGTALSLKNEITASANKPQKISFHSIRGGKNVCQHTIFLHQEEERIEIQHTVSSRQVFAKGALEAAKFIHTKEAGFYIIEDLFQPKVYL